MKRSREDFQGGSKRKKTLVYCLQYLKGKRGEAERGRETISEEERHKRTEKLTERQTGKDIDKLAVTEGRQTDPESKLTKENEGSRKKRQ